MIDGDETAPGTTTELLVVRHGQSTWNRDHRWQGQADPPLSTFGMEQAAKASERVGQVDAIVASPQERAYMTASIIGEAIGVGPVDTFEGLRERHVGPWSGLTRDEINAEWPGWIENDQRPDGWEYDIDVEARVVEALDQIHRRYGQAAVLVVAHGGVIINLERHLGVSEARIPNLHGRIVLASDAGLRAGESIALVPDDMRTGGSSKRQ